MAEVTLLHKIRVLNWVTNSDTPRGEERGPRKHPVEGDAGGGGVCCGKIEYVRPGLGSGLLPSALGSSAL